MTQNINKLQGVALHSHSVDVKVGPNPTGVPVMTIVGANAQPSSTQDTHRLTSRSATSEVPNLATSRGSGDEDTRRGASFAENSQLSYLFSEVERR